MPNSRAASGSEPMAYMSRPARVAPSTTASTIRTAIAINVMIGKPTTVSTERSPNSFGRSPEKYSLPPAHALLMPR